MTLTKYLAHLGYGTRREVAAVLKQRRATRRDGSVVREDDEFQHDDIFVDGEPLDPPPGSVVMLHKPVGYVCSAKEESRLIYELLPPRFLARDPVMASIGRLDRDTSGLLLITDDGKLNHRLSSPRVHLAKTYLVELATDLRGDEGALFASGTLMLRDETTALRAATLEILAPRRARLTITEGRYHQVRRMFAAVGNHVTALYRERIGQLTLDRLEVGTWRLLSPEAVGCLPLHDTSGQTRIAQWPLMP